MVYMIYLWTFLPFFGAAECELLCGSLSGKAISDGTDAVVMILRVWAMYNQSTLIFSILLMFFFLEMISTLLATAIYSAPRNQFGMQTPAG